MYIPYQPGNLIRFKYNGEKRIARVEKIWGHTTFCELHPEDLKYDHEESNYRNFRTDAIQEIEVLS